MHLDRRQFLAAAAATPLLGQLAPPPSYLVILADQLTWWMCDPAQRGVLDLPNIDRLRAEGRIFDRCYATSPVCSAARLTLRTGTWPHANPGLNKLLQPVPTVEQELQSRGYKTQYIGKWHLSPVPVGQYVEPVDRLYWDQFIGHESSHVDDETFVMNDPTPLSTAPWDSGVMTDFAIRMMRANASTAQPFFLHVNYLPPHHPYDKYDPSMSVYSKAEGTLRPNSATAAGFPPKLVSDYMNLVKAVDGEVGRLLAELDRIGHEVVVIFASDHGDMLQSHGMNYKRKPYEEASRVPLIVRGAGWTPGTVTHPVGLVDLARTICGVGQGTDIREYRDSVYYEMVQAAGSWSGGRWRALVSDDGWKLAISEHGPRLLFHLRDDPYEFTDRSGLGMPQEAALETRMREWAHETGDDFFG